MIKYIDTLTVKLKKEKKLNVVSLFSGCGGMDLGFIGNFTTFNNYYEKNPYKIILANDIDKYACQTYNENFNGQSICKDIKELDINNILDSVDIVIGGFPCQDFSHAGKRKGMKSERGQLYKEMKKVVNKLKPKAFIAENVDGLRTMKYLKEETALEKIIKEFEEIGYNVRYKVMNAADYGVPQTRIRVIIIGVRKDLNKEIYYPKEIYNEKNWKTAEEAIDDLWFSMDQNINKHSSRDYSKAKFYPGKKLQGNRKIERNRPSITIRAEHHGNIEAHYRTLIPNDPENMKGWRRLTVRECARIQSFPDEFIFSCSASQAYRQVGNAVPPILAWHIARAVHYTLFN